jgi:hypothetical protein
VKAALAALLADEASVARDADRRRTLQAAGPVHTKWNE